MTNEEKQEAIWAAIEAIPMDEWGDGRLGFACRFKGKHIHMFTHTNYPITIDISDYSDGHQSNTYNLLGISSEKRSALWEKITQHIKEAREKAKKDLIHKHYSEICNPENKLP